MNFSHWPLLAENLKGGLLKEIDLLFAEEILKPFPQAQEKDAALICSIVVSVRSGHLCFFTDKEWIQHLFPDNSRTPFIEYIHAALENPLEGLFGEDGTPFCRIENRIYFHRNYLCEQKILASINRLNSPLPPIFIQDDSLEMLNGAQKEAVKTALSHSLTILTGGPGTGKTYTAAKAARALYQSLPDHEKADFSLVLAAPTGKAAEHLKKGFSKIFDPTIPIHSGTLHTLLNIKKEKSLLHSSAYLRASLIIIDECSMIDAFLFCLLLESISEGCRVILMGDPDQLPAVGAGSIFYDLEKLSFKSPELGYAHLSHCMRSEQKEILELASAVKEGDLLKAFQCLAKPSASLKKTELGFSKYHPPHALKKLQHHTEKWFPYHAEDFSEKLSLVESFEKFKILSCIRKGFLGVDAINLFLKEHFQKKAAYAAFAVYPIMITENDKELNFSNGQTGILFEPKDPAQKAIAFFKESDNPNYLREIPALLLPRYEYAYCLSVHKSQGSEYDHVLFIASKGSEVFGREVLYTALTRAKTVLEIEIDEEVFTKALKTSSRRFSGLCDTQSFDKLDKRF